LKQSGDGEGGATAEEDINGDYSPARDKPAVYDRVHPSWFRKFPMVLPSVRYFATGRAIFVAERHPSRKPFP
jgi:hypothetical protein